MNPLILRISAAFLTGVLTLLALSLYLSGRYLETERRLFIAGDLPGASDAVQTAARLDPFDPEPLQGKSYILQQQGRNEEAAAALRMAIERDPNNYVPYLLLAGLQKSQLRDPEAAEEAYRRVLELNPYASTARNSLADLLLRQGKMEEARREYEKLKEQRQISYEGLYDLGRIYVRTGQAEEGYRTILLARRRVSKTFAGEGRALQNRRTEVIQSIDLALADALVVQGRYNRARNILLRSTSDQAPGLVQLLDTNPAAYREEVMNSDVY